MLTAEENERLTRVGPDTPMGNLLRRYWQPIAASSELDENPVKSVRLLGESLTLFRDRRGKLGLIGDRCAHRHVNLVYGIPEENGLRCCYHGWLYDGKGQCIEQPAEPAGSTFKDKIRIKAYPVEELAGAIFAYLGPEPAPLVPRWDRLTWEGNVERLIVMTVLPCNWLQAVENYPDFCHAQWLHGPSLAYVLERQGVPKDDPRWLEPLARMGRAQVKLGWDYYDHGIVCRILLDGASEDEDLWSVGHPMIFPNALTIAGGGSTSMEWTVPVDDTHTLLLSVQTHRFGDHVPMGKKQESVPYFTYPYDMKAENGERALDVINIQDNMVFESQGTITDRTKEHLGEVDRGVIMLRRTLKEQMAIVDDGGEPMNVFRDPEKNQYLKLPTPARYYARGRAEDGSYIRGAVTAGFITRYSPSRDRIEDLYAASAVAEGRPAN